MMPTISLEALGLLSTLVLAQVPHNQDRPPGPALSPAEAVAKMVVPDGFRVEVFASEPDILNPVAMTFDEKGRIWITESLEYPRRDAGPGRDRIKVIEDTDGDGKADKFTIFMEGLNIPSGIALGNGGVYVANSPDILFVRDTDGDMKADTREVVLTGFGRYDTHELPNTLTWGPDGWLYGLNGVFNPAVVKNEGKEYRFDAALWRYHPRTKAFELFAEGTSNPWGIAFDGEGNAFVSACVIDHLYHLAETGYYHRQAGAYPPFTWKIESVVDHAHQKAAYCGLAVYDADVYPEKFRGRLFMGNIHGSAINVDRLERKGSTYVSHGEDDFLSANDAWFMPVVTKLAPDGCFFITDWYDRYHCYQDANRDPQGIDRLKGRIYRLAYGAAPRAGKLDLSAETPAKLVERLSSPNRWWRDEARRVLSERIASGKDVESTAALKKLVLDKAAAKNARVHALWTLVSAEDPGREPKVIDAAFHLKALALADATLRAWAVRAAGNSRLVSAPVKSRVRELARDGDAGVRLQAAAAARKLWDGSDAVAVLLDILDASRGDPILPRIVWRNLEPLLDSQCEAVAARGPALDPLLGRVVERLLARRDTDVTPLIGLVGSLFRARKEAPLAIAACLDALAKSVSSGGVAEDGIVKLRGGIAKPIGDVLDQGPGDPLFLSALTVACAWKDRAALARTRELALDAKADPAQRSRAIAALFSSRDAAALDAARAILKDPKNAPEDLLRDVLSGLGRLDAPEVAGVALESLDALPPAVRSQALDLLAQRPKWAAALLDAVEAKRVDRASLTLNQVRRLIALKDEAVSKRVESIWGRIRQDRNPEREKVIARIRKVLDAGPGNPWNGKVAFEKTCAKCHTIFGKGANVGPDITVNGRETLDALLSNLLDPNLVIGKGYQACAVATKSGRALTGLLVEDSPQRVVLKVEGGKEEIVPRDDVAALDVGEVSLMPEDLEKTLKEDEIRDLIAYLRYDEAPPEPVETMAGGNADPSARIRVAQEFGHVKVSLRDLGGALPGPDFQEVLDYRHSNDARPFLHPVLPPRGGPLVSGMRPDDPSFQYGVFTGHPSVNGLDFWTQKAWIRSRGLASVNRLDHRVEIVSRADWLTQRRGGRRILQETQRITVHEIDKKRADQLYCIDFDWTLIPEEPVTLGKHDYGGLAFRPAPHEERQVTRAQGDAGQAWLDVSGKFAGGVVAGVAILDHPKNPGFPSVWRTDDQGLMNPAITARGDLRLVPKIPVTFRYRLVVHEGRASRRELDAQLSEWTDAK